MSRKVVIKIGGATFFDDGGFQAPLQCILSEYEHDQVFVMVGGGDLIEAVRTVHRIYPGLSTQEMHWTCVELLDVTWRMSQQLYPLDHAIETREDLDRISAMRKPSASWVRVQSFYSRANHQDIQVPGLPSEDWNTTTDTLAALLGMEIGADRVVLVKRCEIDPAWTIEEATAKGVVDRSLALLMQSNPTHAAQLEIRSVQPGKNWIEHQDNA